MEAGRERKDLAVVLSGVAFDRSLYSFLGVQLDGAGGRARQLRTNVVQSRKPEFKNARFLFHLPLDYLSLTTLTLVVEAFEVTPAAEGSEAKGKITPLAAASVVLQPVLKKLHSAAAAAAAAGASSKRSKSGSGSVVEKVELRRSSSKGDAKVGKLQVELALVPYDAKAGVSPVSSNSNRVAASGNGLAPGSSPMASPRGAAPPTPSLLASTSRSSLATPGAAPAMRRQVSMAVDEPIEADDTLELSILVISAVNLNLQADGSAPNPFVSLKTEQDAVNKVRAKEATMVIYSTRNPVWNQELHLVLSQEEAARDRVMVSVVNNGAKVKNFLAKYILPVYLMQQNRQYNFDVALRDASGTRVGNVFVTLMLRQAPSLRLQMFQASLAAPPPEQLVHIEAMIKAVVRPMPRHVESRVVSAVVSIHADGNAFWEAMKALMRDPDSAVRPTFPMLHVDAADHQGFASMMEQEHARDAPPRYATVATGPGDAPEWHQAFVFTQCMADLLGSRASMLVELFWDSPTVSHAEDGDGSGGDDGADPAGSVSSPGFQAFPREFFGYCVVPLASFAERSSLDGLRLEFSAPIHFVRLPPGAGEDGGAVDAALALDIQMWDAASYVAHSLQALVPPPAPHASLPTAAASVVGAAGAAVPSPLLQSSALHAGSIHMSAHNSVSRSVARHGAGQRVPRQAYAHAQQQQQAPGVRSGLVPQHGRVGRSLHVQPPPVPATTSSYPQQQQQQHQQHQSVHAPQSMYRVADSMEPSMGMTGDAANGLDDGGSMMLQPPWSATAAGHGGTIQASLPATSQFVHGAPAIITGADDDGFIHGEGVGRTYEEMIRQLEEDVARRNEALITVGEEMRMIRRENQQLRQERDEAKSSLRQREDTPPAETPGLDAMSRDEMTTQLRSLTHRYRKARAATAELTTRVETLQNTLIEKNESFLQVESQLLELQRAHVEQGHVLERLRAENSKIGKYKELAKKQEQRIRNLELVLEKVSSRPNSGSHDGRSSGSVDSEMSQRIAELEEENARLRRQAAAAAPFPGVARPGRDNEVKRLRREASQAKVRAEALQKQLDEQRSNARIPGSGNATMLTMRAEKAEARVHALEQQLGGQIGGGGG